MNKKLVSNIIKTVFVFGFYLICYVTPKYFLDFNNLHYIKTYLDDCINIHTPSVIVYILAYLQWFLGLYYACKQDDKHFYFVLCSLTFASLIGFLIFVFYPTAIVQTPINGNSIFDKMLLLLRSCDGLTNALPSFHCMFSWLIYRTVKMKNKNRKLNVCNFIFSILVFASTVLTKQHYCLDIPAGILLTEVSIFLSSLLIKRFKFSDTI